MLSIIVYPQFNGFIQIEDKSDNLKDNNSPLSIDEDLNTELSEPNYNVHVFYYPWYGSPQHDARYLHWNHEYIQHWDKTEAKKWPKGRHVPPDDIGSNFYPELGPYSSRAVSVMEDHMQQILTSGIG